MSAIGEGEISKQVSIIKVQHDNIDYTVGSDIIKIFNYALSREYVNGYGTAYIALGKKSVQIYEYNVKWQSRNLGINGNRTYRVINKDLHDKIKYTAELVKEAESIPNQDERLAEQIELLNSFKRYVEGITL